MENSKEKITITEILVGNNSKLESYATINKPNLNLKNAKKILQKMKEANSNLETQKNKSE